MGCWHETCGFTNLPITDGTPCRMMFIKRVPPEKGRRSWDGALFYAFDLFHPVSRLVRGTYNDYGWMDFDEGEKERLFESANSVGVSVIKEENSNPVFPRDTYQWMIREDAFQMLAKLPLESWRSDGPKTVGASINQRRDAFKKYAEALKELSGNGDIWPSFKVSEEMRRQFDTGEMPAWPLRHELMDKVQSLSPEEAWAGAQDLFDLIQVFIGMNAVRKNLVPTIGAGSQTYNDGAYHLLAEFTEDALLQWKQYLNEEEDEAEDDLDIVYVTDEAKRAHEALHKVVPTVSYEDALEVLTTLAKSDPYAAELLRGIKQNGKPSE